MSGASVLTDGSLVAFAPCGCWIAVQVEYADLAENARRTTEFVRDAQRMDRLNRVRVERLTMDGFRALRNGANGDLSIGCDHDPEWGGIEPTHDYCPRCHKQVKKLKNGRLAAHKDGWFTCSQEPYGGAA